MRFAGPTLTPQPLGSPRLGYMLKVPGSRSDVRLFEPSGVPGDICSKHIVIVQQLFSCFHASHVWIGFEFGSRMRSIEDFLQSSGCDLGIDLRG